MRYETSSNGEFIREMDFNKFAKSAAVVVSGCLCITERFEQRVSCNEKCIKWNVEQNNRLYSNEKKNAPSRIFCSIGPAAMPPESHRYLRMYLVLSVLPAPDSPETTIDCDCLSTLMSLKALSTGKFKHKRD